ncbi:MAG: thioredoxin-like domain-containing protein [Pirellulales bacterium]
MSQKLLLLVTLVFCGWYGMASAQAAPSVADALKLAPVQKGIEYDRPSPEESKRCTIQAEKRQGAVGWVVRSPSGQILRSFADSNDDNIVDIWSYYLGGLMVYRDIDSNFNGKADEYRWFHTAGGRWGHDSDENGKIDRWKMISAEELAEEVVVALSKRDVERFSRLQITGRELGKLGLAKKSAQQLASRVKLASQTFQKTAQKFPKNSEFTDFGGQRPGVVPAGSHGLSKDLLVYENVWAMVLQDGQPLQLQLGTMIQIDGVWKLVDGPVSDASGKTITGFFFNSGTDNIGLAETPTENSGPSEKMQQVLVELEKLDQKITNASEEQQADLYGQQADLLEKLAMLAPDQQQQNQWIGQMADMVSATVQSGNYPKGVARLKTLEKKLANQKSSTELHAHVLFRRLQAEYGLSLSQPKVDYAKVQENWLKQLEEFVDEHGKCSHAPEALLQLAMASEFAEEADDAKIWYQRILNDFPKSTAARKSQGALNRLADDGSPLSLRGPTLGGGKVDLSQYRGKYVLVQYWSTSYQSCKADHLVLKDLYVKYGGKNFDVLGVNLDFSSEEAQAYLQANRLPWKQMYEPGGFDSRLANEIGLISLPLMLLIDEKGTIVSSSIQSTELEGVLKSRLSAKGTRTAKRK